MNNNSEAIEQRLREEAERLLGGPPPPGLLRSLQTRGRWGNLRRVSLEAALLLTSLAFVAHYIYRDKQIARNVEQQTSPQQSAGKSTATAIIVESKETLAADPGTTNVLYVSHQAQTVDYYSLSPPEQFAVRRFLETDGDPSSTDFWENSL